MSEPYYGRVDQLFAEGVAIDRGLRRGVLEALRRHKKLGQPIVVWEDGKIVWVPPEEIQIDEDGNSRQ